MVTLLALLAGSDAGPARGAAGMRASGREGAER